MAGVALAPVTAGASAAAGLSYAAVATTTAAGATVALSGAEFIASCATLLGVLGIAASVINTVAKNYNVKVNAGSTTVECTRK